MKKVIFKSTVRNLAHSLGKRFLRAVSTFQSRHSKIPDTPFLPNATFSCTSLLESHWKLIRNEFEAIWLKPEDIPSFHQISPDQSRISKGENWKTFAFYVFGSPVEENCKICPDTSRVLSQIEGLQNAWFSILAPGYKVPPHRGPTKALVRCHLGLRIPAIEEKCWIRVDDEIRYWSEGKCMLFDDTYEHEVENGTEEHRAVLFIDLDRPMDRVGSTFNRLLLSMIQASHYVREPLANLSEWNRNLRRE